MLLFKKTILVHFWKDEPNFGDALNIDILEHYGLATAYANVQTAELFAIGSILHRCPPSYDGIILGSGYIGDHVLTHRRLKHAKVLAVRGPKSAKFEELHGVVTYGDLGILAARVFVDEPVLSAPSEVAGRVAVVPHYADFSKESLAWFKSRPDYYDVIDVRQSPKDVVSRIRNSRAVVSSSLHGLIIADSYNLPAAWVKFGDDVCGGDFKFDDYHLALGMQRASINVQDNSAEHLPPTSFVKVDPLAVLKMQESLDRHCRSLYWRIVKLRLLRFLRAAFRFRL